MSTDFTLWYGGEASLEISETSSEFRMSLSGENYYAYTRNLTGDEVIFAALRMLQIVSYNVEDDQAFWADVREKINEMAGKTC